MEISKNKFFEQFKNLIGGPWMKYFR